jgi:protein-S-isoprenylcysteine O-methyltransferase Ste14
MSIYKKWADKAYPLPLRIAATLCGAIIFVLLIPLFFLRFGTALDRQWGLQITPVNLIWKAAGGIFLLIGLFFALWSIGDQIVNGRGTPIPVIATQKLLVHGPFQYSRNPMGFGTSLAYLGLSFYMASLSMVVFSMVFAGLFILYIKLVEEKELLERFGESYREYMRSTPFFIPKGR